MRSTVGTKANDDDALIRHFINNFEYIFGGSDSDSDCLTEDEDGEKKPLLNRRKKESSIVASINRPINSTYSYTSSDPSLFRPKRNFMTTRDVVAVMMKNSKDFLSSQARARCRILQRPEMWGKLVEQTKSDDEYCSADYESMILQLMEFRLMYEYLNSGAGGEPFSNIRKAYSSSEEAWAQKEKQIKDMEEGAQEVTESTKATSTEQVTPTPVVSLPKKTKKQRMMEQIAAAQAAAAAAAAAAGSVQSNMPESTSDSDSETSEDADTLVMNHRRKRLGSSDSTTMVAPPVVASKPPQAIAPLSHEDDLHDDSEWIQVGSGATAAPRTRKVSGDVTVRSRKSSSVTATTTFGSKATVTPTVNHEKRKPLRQLSAAHKSHKFRLWVQSRPGCEYVCDSLSVKAVPKATFFHIVPAVSGSIQHRKHIRECPF